MFPNFRLFQILTFQDISLKIVYYNSKNKSTFQVNNFHISNSLYHFHNILFTIYILICVAKIVSRFEPVNRP